MITKYLHILSHGASEGGAVQNDWADLTAFFYQNTHNPLPYFPSLYPVPLYDTPYPLNYSGTHRLHIKMILLTNSAEYFSFFWLCKFYAGLLSQTEYWSHTKIHTQQKRLIR